MALVAAFAAAGYVFARALDDSTRRPDLEPLLCGARVAWTGGDAYAVTGPGKTCSWAFAQLYPAPALVAVSPLAWLPPLVATALFCAASTFAFVLAITRDGWYRLPLLLSAGYQSAMSRAQWEPLLVAGVVYPLLGGLIAAKPNAGLIALVGARSKRALITATLAAAVLVVLSLALAPRWPAGWLQALASNVQTVALVPLGVLGALALPRWREGQARTAFAYGVLPMSQLPYASVLLFLAPRTWRQACLMALASDLALIIMLAGGPYGGSVQSGFLPMTAHYARWGAPFVLGTAVWCVWSRSEPESAAPRALVAATILAGLFVLWLSFAISGS